MRPDNAAAQLANAQSGRKEAAKKGKGIFREALVHPPNPGKGLRPLHSQFTPICCGGEKGKRNFSGTPRTPAKGFALCTPSSLQHVYSALANGFPDGLPELMVHFDIACSFSRNLNYM